MPLCIRDALEMRVSVAAILRHKISAAASSERADNARVSVAVRIPDGSLTCAEYLARRIGGHADVYTSSLSHLS